MTIDISPDRYEEIRALVRTQGLRATRGRIVVYTCLDQASSPVSHRELVERLVPEGFDRATIYRNLTDLTQAGLVRRIDVGDHTWRFELAHEHHDDGEHEAAEVHPHFTCVDCGKVVCLDGVTLQVSAGVSAPQAVLGQQVEIHLRGVCDHCTPQENQGCVH